MLNKQKPFFAITAQSEIKESDETDYGKEVVDKFKLNWFKVKPDYNDFKTSILDIIRAQEEPFRSPSIVMQYFVMKKSKDLKVHVLLDGQGADETLLGYDRYYSLFILRKILKFKFLIRGPIQGCN